MKAKPFALRVLGANEPDLCDKDCHMCHGTQLAKCPASAQEKCWLWEIPCRHLKTNRGYHWHMCPWAQARIPPGGPR